MIGYDRKIMEALAQLLGVSVSTADSILEVGAWIEHNLYEAGVVGGKWLVVYKDGVLLHKVNLKEGSVL